MKATRKVGGSIGYVLCACGVCRKMAGKEEKGDLEVPGGLTVLYIPGNVSKKWNWSTYNHESQLAHTENSRTKDARRKGRKKASKTVSVL